MIKTIGATGPRALTSDEAAQAVCELADALDRNTRLHVGDADGLDLLARQVAAAQDCLSVHVYRPTISREPWALQARSKRMVDAVAVAGGVLHAWPNKPCPASLTVERWKGSGTWGTVRYAVAKGVAVELHWLCPATQLPEWLACPQLKLL